MHRILTSLRGKHSSPGVALVFVTSCWLLVASVVSAGRAVAQTGTATLPAPVGYVNDFAELLPPDAEARLEVLAERVRTLTRGEMAVVTLRDLGGRPVEEVALRLGREWKIGAMTGIGDAARNAGVVILIVPKQTSRDGRGYCRIETGQGTEAFLLDSEGGSICRAATPQFKAGDYAGGIESVAYAVAEEFASEFGVALDSVPPRGTVAPSDEGEPSFLLTLIVVVLFIVLSSTGRRRTSCLGCIPITIGGPPTVHGGWSSGGWSGGSDWGGSSGGFGGFGGGGGFSGGGGGSSW